MALVRKPIIPTERPPLTRFILQNKAFVINVCITKKELSNVFSSLNVIRMTNWNWMRWEEHVARMRNRKMRIIFYDFFCRDTWYRLCGLVVRVSDYRLRDPGSIPGATRLFRTIVVGYHAHTLLDELHWAEPFLRSYQLCSYTRTYQHFIKPECSLPCSQEPNPDP
jgi:hypothetical protein